MLRLLQFEFDVDDVKGLTSVARVCVFLTSDEVAITAFAINIPGKGEFRSAVIGVGPTFPQFLCITLPKSARPTKPTVTTFTAAGLDRAVNIAFDQQRITLTR